MGTLQTIQDYAITSYASPGSHMPERSAYQIRRQWIADAFHVWAKDKAIDVLIDIGSSTGFLTRRIKGLAKKVIAVDAERRVLDKIGDPEIDTVLDRLPELSYLQPSSADVIISTDTLYYLSEKDIPLALDRIFTVLRRQGYLVFNDNGNADSLAEYLASSFTFCEIVKAPQSLKSTPNFDWLYFKIEAKYLFCRGLFNALKDPEFDSASDMSELKDGRLVQFCMKHRWIEHWLCYCGQSGC